MRVERRTNWRGDEFDYDMSADVIDVALDLVMKEAGSSDRQRGFSVVGGFGRLGGGGFSVSCNRFGLIPAFACGLERL